MCVEEQTDSGPLSGEAVPSADRQPTVGGDRISSSSPSPIIVTPTPPLREWATRPDGYTNDVNDSGLVIGYYYNEGITRGYTWQDGVMTEIVSTLGGDRAGANALNNHDTIAGWAYINESQRLLSSPRSVKPRRPRRGR